MPQYLEKTYHLACPQTEEYATQSSLNQDITPLHATKRTKTIPARIKATDSQDQRFHNPKFTSTYTLAPDGLWTHITTAGTVVVVPDCSALRTDIIAESHTPACMGHVGIERTLHNIHALSTCLPCLTHTLIC